MQVTRLGDICDGECRVGHVDVEEGKPKKFVAVFISGAETVFVNHVPQVIVGSLGEADCGHTISAIAGSDSVFAEHQPICRVGDLIAVNEGEGEGVSISSSEDVGN
jgi:uncharacterized Zn-binding protein involved in type VI secretion